MNLSNENNVIKNMAKEVVRDCGHAGVTVSNSLASYVVRILLLDPAKGYSAEKVMERSLTQKLVDECVENLLKPEDPSMCTIRLQVHWASNYISRDIQKRENRISVGNKALPLLKEIVDSTCHSKEEAERLHRKMVSFTILYSGLGNPTTVSVVKEASAALYSVFRVLEIEQFVIMSRREKEQQMIELTQIVTGIRLFNRDCQKGGESIDDLPSILTQAVEATRERISQTLSSVMTRVHQLTSTVEAAYNMQSARERAGHEDVELEVCLPTHTDRGQLDDLKKALVIMRQHEICLKKLGVELELDKEELEGLLEQLKKILLQLHETVRFRTAIPTVQVYPLFIDLSCIWTDLQDETRLLSHINTLVFQLTKMNKYMMPLPLEEELCLATPISDAERLEVTTGIFLERSDAYDPDVTVLLPSNVSNFDDIYIQLEGFCAWSLVQGQGALIPGNPNLGLLQFGGFAYAFSTAEVAGWWARDPHSYLLKTLNLARTRPELIFLLNLHEQLEAVKSKVLITSEKEVIMTADAEVQTVLHPVESYIDKDYSFSEWEWKRRAIQLANMVKCKTTSQQTVNHSHFRAHIGLQVAPDKDRVTQTKRDNSCNHSTISTFFWGLRGQQEVEPHVVTVTLPFDNRVKKCCPSATKTSSVSRRSSSKSVSSVHLQVSPESSACSCNSEQNSEPK